MRLLILYGTFLIVSVLLMLPGLASAQDKAHTLPTESTDEIQAADKVIRNYMIAVSDQIGGRLQELGSQDAILKKFEELGEKHLLANKDVLHSKAKAEYLKLQVWTMGENVKLEAIKTDSKEIAEFQVIFSGGHGIPPYDRHTFTTKWWEPEFAAKTLRELVFRQALSEKEVERRKFIEQFSAPQLYRRNDDIEKPSLAYFDGKELFVVNLKYTELGIYALEKIEWFTYKTE